MRAILLPLISITLIGIGACATGAPLVNEEALDRTLRVQVANECSDIVHVYFVTESGTRVRLGSVGPHATTTLAARLPSAQAGYLAVRRMAELSNGALVLQGALEPAFLAGALVHVTVGIQREFDRWTLLD